MPKKLAPYKPLIQRLEETERRLAELERKRAEEKPAATAKAETQESEQE